MIKVNFALLFHETRKSCKTV